MMKIAINICLLCLFLAGCAKEPDAVPKPMVKERAGYRWEVSVYPGYDNHSERTLPQIYVIDDNTVVLYCMWEYFLPEK